MEGDYEIEYLDGSKEIIASWKVCQYYFQKGSSDLKFIGTGISGGWLERSLQERKPIILSKEGGRFDVAKIINTPDIRAIIPL